MGVNDTKWWHSRLVVEQKTSRSTDTLINKIWYFYIQFFQHILKCWSVTNSTFLERNRKASLLFWSCFKNFFMFQSSNLYVLEITYTSVQGIELKFSIYGKLCKTLHKETWVIFVAAINTKTYAYNIFCRHTQEEKYLILPGWACLMW